VVHLRRGGIKANKSRMTEKVLIQRSYKMMSIVNPHLIKSGESSLKKGAEPGHKEAPYLLKEVFIPGLKAQDQDRLRV
jgi:hypothetical protein